MESMGNDTTAVSEPDSALESAKLLYNQAEFLLNDEIRFAAALRMQRSTTATLLVVVVGIGLFRISFYGTRDDILLIPTWAMFATATLFSLAAMFVLSGTWNLFSERPLIGSDPALALDKGEIAHVHSALASGKSDAALSVLHLSRRHRKILERASPLIVVRAQAMILRVAYERLAAANRRVRYRIERGRSHLLVGLALVFVAFVLYFWSIAIHGTTI